MLRETLMLLEGCHSPEESGTVASTFGYFHDFHE